MKCGRVARKMLWRFGFSSAALVFLSLAASIFTANLYAESAKGETGNASSLPYSLGLLTLGGIGLMAFGLARRPRANSSTSADPVSDLSHTLVNEDCRALTIAMTELAQGNLTAQLSIRSQPLDPNSIPEMREFALALNGVVDSLKETAREFNAVTEVPCHRVCYVGADSFIEGQACARAMGEALGRSGKVAIITSEFTKSGPEMRRKGFISALHDRFPGIEVVTSVEATEAEDLTYQKTKEILRRYPNLNGLYVTYGSCPYVVAKAVVEEGRQGQVRLVSHDLVDETMRYVQQGAITATLGQDPFAQGHEPVIHMYNYLAAGWRPPAPRLLTSLDVVTKENYQHFWHPDRGAVETAAMAGRRSSPLPVDTTRPIRILVVSREDSKFWTPIHEGVMAAADRLRPLNVTVDWVCPPENRNSGITSTEIYGPLIESAISQKYDGLITGVFDTDYIPFINRVVAAGIPVMTHNSEPTSLRGLVFAIADQAESLMGMSQNLASTVNAVNQATRQINTAMGQVSRGTLAQNEQVSQTHEALSSLLKHIDEVSTEAHQGSSAAEDAARAAHAGTEAVEKTLASMQGIKDSVLETAHTVQALGEHSQKIDIIIKLIGGIAYQIKLLGINAAIEAAHAGQYGAGFLVVAGEIRSLAERTASATREITDLVDSVQTQIGKVQKVMGSGLERVSHGATLAEQAGRVLGEIREAVEANHSRLKGITAAMANMQSFSHQVGGVMDSVASISEENAAAVEEVTASTKEMSSQLTEATQLAQALARMAEAEQQMIAKFNLSSR